MKEECGMHIKAISPAPFNSDMSNDVITNNIVIFLIS